MFGLLVWSSALLAANRGDDVKSLAEYCKQISPQPSICDVTDSAKVADLAKPAAPYLAARIFWAGDSETTPNNSCYLGIQTARGWTVAQVGTDCWGNGKYYRRPIVREMDIRGGKLWLHFDVESSDPDVDGPELEEYVVVCGMTDEAPRCTAPIQLSNGKWKVKASLDKKGQLVLTLAKGKRSAIDEQTAAVLGTNKLSFE
ncbi:MAG: hypothetical protein QM831_31870 [Kofleriaceae bacterium]